jgi:hypothetical protein
MRRIPLVILLTLIVFRASAQADDATPCKLYGAIFGVDPIGGTLLIKNPDGYLKNVNLPAATAVSKLAVTAGGSVTTIRPSDLNTGDLVCVQGDSNAAPRVSVVLRTDLHRAQSEFLVAWQRNSLYGTLASIDVSGRTFVVKPLPSSAGDTPVRVSLPSSVKLRAASPEARRITESTSFALKDLEAGEPVYVRGTRSANGSEMAASLVLKGGYRGILGMLVEVQVLSSTLRIREFGTGETLNIKMTPGETYRTTENLTHWMRVETASGVVLAPVGLADLSSGDAILVIGKAGAGASETEGLVAVTKFGTFGVVPQDPQGRVSWLMTK